MDTNKKCFLLYNSFWQVIEGLPNEDLGELTRVIFSYQTTGKIPKMEKHIKMAFDFIKIQFDIDDAKWEKKAAANKENGLKGGRPKRNPQEPTKPSGFSGNPTKPKKPVDVDVDVEVDVDDDVEVEIININLKNIVDFYNQVFDKNVRSYSGFEKNFEYWARIHSAHKMKQAIEIASKDKFWKDKLTLQILFRRKNPRGEDVDYIEDLNNRTASSSGGIAFL